MDVSVGENLFRERLRQYSLSELEDVYAHMDRDAFPERYKLVESEIEDRLSLLGDQTEASEVVEGDSPGIRRRVASGFVDAALQVIVPYILLYFLAKVLFPSLMSLGFFQFLFPESEAQGPGRGRRRRR